MMRIALFSPLPPCPSGIADYTAALVEPLRRLADVEVFGEGAEEPGDGRFDVAVYQIGNNPWHAAAYEAALRRPGVAVLHEFNLHHLVAEMTIKRGDWDAYLREVEYEGGAIALERARRVRALETGPDYEGVPMVRRILDRSRAVIVHSLFMARKVRAAGFTGPVGRIPHGAWTPRVDRHAWRRRLGLDETATLVGIFGHLKPYKRIPESLRAFRRLLRLEPRARMILVGERHPDLPLDALIKSLDLRGAVRQTGFAGPAEFEGYLAACDIVLNLRYPTVGETSGTLLRALGMGKAVVVSDVGAFQELPADICLKAEPGAGEEDLLFEYLNLLVSRAAVRRALGRRALEWVERCCTWEKAAEGYAAFLAAVVEGRAWPEPGTEAEPRPAAVPAGPPAAPVPPETVEVWAAPEPGAREYVRSHIDRLTRTLEITPPGGPDDRILEMGSYLQITPALKRTLGYGEVRGCYYGPAGRQDRRRAISRDGEEFECVLDLFDAERDPFPYPDGHFSTVICGELIEHLAADPMHMMSEVNRVLRAGGHLVLTTPNIGSLRALAAVLEGYHPGFFPAYLRPAVTGAPAGARHSREYTPKEIARLLIDSGFEVTLLETGEFREEPRPEHHWVRHLLDRYGLPSDLRGDGIYAVGRKTGPVRERYPEWLYNG